LGEIFFLKKKMGSSISKICTKLVAKVFQKKFAPLLSKIVFTATRRDIQGAGVGKILRDEIIQLSEAQQTALLERHPNVQLLLNPEFGIAGSKSDELDAIATRFSDHTFLDILFTNMAASERIVQVLPLKRRMAIANNARALSEWATNLEIDEELTSGWRHASNEIELCLERSIVGDKPPKDMNELKNSTLPTIDTNADGGQVVFYGLAPNCLRLIREEIGVESDKVNRDMEDLNAIAIDSGMLVINNLEARQIEHYQSWQLTMAMLPSLS
jgi:hypothetical protein